MLKLFEAAKKRMYQSNLRSLSKLKQKKQSDDETAWFIKNVSGSDEDVIRALNTVKKKGDQATIENVAQTVRDQRREALSKGLKEAAKLHKKVNAY